MYIVLSRASKTRRFNVSREARTSEILLKPTEKPNQRLTSLYKRFISSLSVARSALCSWLPTCGTMPFHLYNPFHARHSRKFGERSGSTSSSMGVCGFNVFVYGRLGLLRPFGRLWFQRPLLWAYGSSSFSFELFRTNASPEGISRQRPHLREFAAPSCFFIEVCASAHGERLCLLIFAVAGLYVVRLRRKVFSVSNTSSNAETSFDSLQLALLVRC